MINAIAAGLRYFFVVFAIGFLLGTLRTLAVAPWVGDVAAVSIELPFMLMAAWIVCRRMARDVSPRLPLRLAMGATAFTGLMATELAVSAWFFDRAPAAWAAGMATTAGGLGVAGQIGFGLMPLVVRR
jgi:uncharacterized membrane protein YcfT